MQPVSLDLNTLSAGLPALTPAMGRVLAESAAVCLDRNTHVSPTHLLLEEPDTGHTYLLQWPTVDEQMRRTHNDIHDATEFGACGVAILLVRELTGLTIVERSMKSTGIDYWLAPDDGNALPFQNAARLEVSGILCGSKSKVDSRVTQKREQSRRSDSSESPAFIAIVEFGTPQARVAKREPTT